MQKNKKTTKPQVNKPVYLDIHSMPVTSEQSFKLWYIMGAVILILLVIIFLLFLI